MCSWCMMSATPTVQVLQWVWHDWHGLPSRHARPAQRLPGCGEVMNLGRRQRRPNRLQRPTLDCYCAAGARGKVHMGAAVDDVAACTVARRQRGSKQHAATGRALSLGWPEGTAGGLAVHSASAVAAVHRLALIRSGRSNICFPIEQESLRQLILSEALVCVHGSSGRQVFGGCIVWLALGSSRSNRLRTCPFLGLLQTSCTVTLNPKP